jgi:hypothetical protein
MITLLAWTFCSITYNRYAFNKQPLPPKGDSHAPSTAASREALIKSEFVIPAYAGIQCNQSPGHRLAPV